MAADTRPLPSQSALAEALARLRADLERIESRCQRTLRNVRGLAESELERALLHEVEEIAEEARISRVS